LTAASTGRSVGRVKLPRGGLPPLMQRTLRDDLKWALGFLSGVTIGYFVLGADDPSLWLDFVVGAAVLIVVLNVLRRVRARRKA
jgi:hypothetical protein